VVLAIDQGTSGTTCLVVDGRRLLRRRRSAISTAPGSFGYNGAKDAGGVTLVVDVN
jgi:hypothetical protein